MISSGSRRNSLNVDEDKIQKAILRRKSLQHTNSQKNIQENNNVFVSQSRRVPVDTISKKEYDPQRKSYSKIVESSKRNDGVRQSLRKSFKSFLESHTSKSLADEHVDIDPSSFIDEQALKQIIEAKIDSRTLKPSDVVTKRLAKESSTSKTHYHHHIRSDPPFLYRIFQCTAQPCLIEPKSLNSSASFLIICDEDEKIILWNGINSQFEDQQYALSLAIEVTKKDWNHYENDAEKARILIITEGREVAEKNKFEYFFRLLSCTEAHYRSKKLSSIRRLPLENNDVRVYNVNPNALNNNNNNNTNNDNNHSSNNEKNFLRLFSQATPLSSQQCESITQFRRFLQQQSKIEFPVIDVIQGQVERMTFPTISSTHMIIAIEIGTEWYLWKGRHVSPQEVLIAKNGIANISLNMLKIQASFLNVNNNNNPNTNTTTNGISSNDTMSTTAAGGGGGVENELTLASVLKHIRVIRQGYERVLFREHFKIFTDFEPENLTISKEKEKESKQPQQEQLSSRSIRSIHDGENHSDGDLNSIKSDDDDDDDDYSSNRRNVPFKLAVAGVHDINKLEIQQQQQQDQSSSSSSSEVVMKSNRRLSRRQTQTNTFHEANLSNQQQKEREQEDLLQLSSFSARIRNQNQNINAAFQDNHIDNNNNDDDDNSDDNSYHSSRGHKKNQSIKNKNKQQQQDDLNQDGNEGHYENASPFKATPLINANTTAALTATAHHAPPTRNILPHERSLLLRNNNSNSNITNTHHHHHHDDNSDSAFRGSFVISHELLTPEQRVEVMHRSIYEPKSLVGYQIEIDEGNWQGDYLITGFKYDFFWKSTPLFKITRVATDINTNRGSGSSGVSEAWLKLKRGRKCKGEIFRLIKCVFNHDEVDENSRSARLQY